MKVEKKIEEAKKRFIKGTKFVSIDYPDRGLSNEQINDEIIFHSRYLKDYLKIMNVFAVAFNARYFLSFLNVI